ncbi:MAG: hypothetical protein K9N46_01035 [Candidatus Marinimicrobia bacterium]|nr:hypothetical protein [Candidatus Neomarinimicrobiota bacterium]MCF7827939.1 hypothetical protein [Candidatus Neomarinimicrobiota bacterium]MCF7879306.1 hypothetical protein [Candidatus Neomarinimicrobiota bacterium]
MPLKPNILERFLINRGVVPNILLDLGMSTFQIWTMLGAMEVGIFEALDEQPDDIPGLAERLDASERGLKVLINALEPLDYLESSNGKYRLTKAAERSLPLDLLQDMVPFFKSQMQAYKDVARAIKEAPEDGIYGWEHVKSGEVGRSYQVSMRWLASNSVDEVVDTVDLPNDAKKMLDVGGSHGLYTVEYCRKYPELQGTVLDWEIGLENARETLKDHPDMQDRIDLVERDFEEEELPSGYDFAFLGNIIHGITPEGNQELFGKLARATTDIGTVAILDQFAGVSGSKFARGVAGLAGFNLFLFSGGRSYEFDRVKGWFQDVGFTKVEHEKTRQPGFSLVIARK